MKRIIFILFSVLICISIHAQKETYTWYFGLNAGMDFKNTTTLNHPTYGMIYEVPRYISGPIKTHEGCFTMSDKEGNFLFASDGMTVYDKNKAVMPNGSGLLGHPSASQSGIVVPMPGSPRKYYVISVPHEGDRAAGYTYSVVDLELRSGLGDVVAGKKNLPISIKNSGYTKGDTPENITVVGHTNGHDYWLVSRIRKKFLVWAVTRDGISDPVGYDVPFDLDHSKVSAYGMGYVKFSPNGRRVVHADYAQGRLSYADFDPTHGVISNTNSITTDAGKMYGIEFSPNGKYLYLTCIQYSAPAKNGLYIIKTEQLTPNLTHLNLVQAVPNISNVQLGRANRIYAISQYAQKSLWIILNPDEGGNKIVEIPTFFPGAVGASSTNVPWLGLPPFNTTYFRTEGVFCDYTPCIMRLNDYEVYLFQPVGKEPIAYMEWDFGDGSPKVRQDYAIGTTSYRVAHAFKDVGKQTITVKPYDASNNEVANPLLKVEVNVRYCNLLINSATHTLPLKR